MRTLVQGSVDIADSSPFKMRCAILIEVKRKDLTQIFIPFREPTCAHVIIRYLDTDWLRFAVRGHDAFLGDHIRKAASDLRIR